MMHRKSYRTYINWGLLALSLVLVSACQQGKQGEGQQELSEEIITTRTMGLALLEDNKLEEAEEKFLELTRLAPGEAIGYANLGLVYLRTGQYEEAREMLSAALEITPEDPDIRFNLSTAHKFLNDNDAFIAELEKNIRNNPGHIQSHYRLAESYLGGMDASAQEKRRQHLQNCVELSPANIVPRLHLMESQLRADSCAPALDHLQEIRRIFPELSEEALEQYRLAYAQMEAGKSEEALRSTMIFHNYLKLTNPYQNGITELKGYEGASVGVPTFTFSSSLFNSTPDGGSILASLRFTEAGEAAGLAAGTLENEEKAAATHLALGDFNHDGSEDIFLGNYSSDGDYQSHMLRAELGRFKDKAGEFKISHRGPSSFASFNDYNNDGWFDLLVIDRGEPVLHESIDQGIYKDVSRRAFSGKVKNKQRALYFDMDHEGDLDLLFLGEGTLQLMRNNGDGSFSDFSKESGLKGSGDGNRDALFGDFDDDGDVDLVVLTEAGGALLYTNLREGRFREITKGSGLEKLRDLALIKSADFNNDGYMDLFAAGREPGSHMFLLNDGQGKFGMGSSGPGARNSESGTQNSESGIPGSQGESPAIQILDAAFLDFDNDGWMDLAMVGIPGSEGGRGGILLHNQGDGSFSDVSELLPEDFAGGRQVATADFNSDGDLDLYLVDLKGGMRLLRNDGGNVNHHLKVRLRGIRTGSGKNNHFGIGARIELRAGTHYQMQMVTGPIVFFGLAERSDVDVVRILWTNGTPQNIYTPGIEQDLIEEQQLKGSCPFLYAWNGDSFDFVKDVMWRSALGMPMGIMGGEQNYAFAEASEDYHLIPGEMLREKNGRYQIQITEELWETIYLDKVELLAVDHPEGSEVFVDEHFTPPPYPPLKVYSVEEKIFPVRALNRDGLDVRDLLLEKDNRYVNTPPKGRYQGITETSILELDPGDAGKDGKLTLYLNGWIFPTDASINLALSQGENEVVRPPSLQVLNRKGAWETVIPNMGFPQGKNKTVVAELEGLYLSADRRVRILTEMQIYWDQAFFSHAAQDSRTVVDPESPLRAPHMKVTRMKPAAADHHYRGFSRMYRKGGATGPHWFDYQEVDPNPMWRDLTGMYTRFGEVNELLQEADNMYIIANAGEETSMEFLAADAGDLPAGWTRDFLVYCVGWVKDGDMNTGEGNRVEPLPYHGMGHYPYAHPSAYPMDARLRAYHAKYNTREVTGEAWRRAVFSMQ